MVYGRAPRCTAAMAVGPRLRTVDHRPFPAVSAAGAPPPSTTSSPPLLLDASNTPNGRPSLETAQITAGHNLLMSSLFWIQAAHLHLLPSNPRPSPACTGNPLSFPPCAVPHQLPATAGAAAPHLPWPPPRCQSSPPARCRSLIAAINLSPLPLSAARIELAAATTWSHRLSSPPLFSSPKGHHLEPLSRHHGHPRLLRALLPSKPPPLPPEATATAGHRPVSTMDTAPIKDLLLPPILHLLFPFLCSWPASISSITIGFHIFPLASAQLRPPAPLPSIHHSP